MNWDDFLAEIADNHGLEGAQRKFFLMRFSEENLNKNEKDFQFYLESKSDLDDPVKTFRKQMTGVYKALGQSLPKVADNTRNKADKIRPWLKQRYEALSEDVVPESGEIIDQRILFQACIDLLERQKRLTTNTLMAKDGITFEPDDLFVPLGLVERKKRPKRHDIESSDQGSQLYEPTEEEITQKFNHQEFFDQVIRDGETKSKGKRLAIIGEPGAGKTTLLQKIGDWLRDNDQVPIWISLANVGTKPLQEYLLKDWLQDAAETIEPPDQEWKTALQQLLKSNQACLLLDGVDEMVVPNALQWIGEQLKAGWANSVRVVLTCRLNVWESSALEGFDVYRNLDFDYPEQVRQFIDQFFQREGGDATLGEGLKEELEKPGKERIRDSIKNPLRLSLLCYSWELGSGELPETKAELYRQFVNAFYKLKERELPIKIEQQKDLNRALGELAKEAIERISSRFLLRESFIKELLGEPHQEGTLFWEACRLSWLNDIGITAEKPYEKAYAFIHPTFQEYFAAISIKDNWNFFLKDIPELPEKGTYKIFDKKWEEPLLLWAGLTSQLVGKGSKECLIRELINFKDGYFDFSSLQIKDDGFYRYRAYLLAGLILAEESFPELEDIVFGKLSKWAFYERVEKYGQKYCHTPFDPIEKSAKQILGQIKSKALLLLLENLLKDESNIKIAIEIAAVLGKNQSDHPLALKVLKECLSIKEDHLNIRAADILGEIGYESQKAINLLLASLNDAEDGNCIIISSNLSKIAVGNTQALSVLLEFVKSASLKGDLLHSCLECLNNIATSEIQIVILIDTYLSQCLKEIESHSCQDSLVFSTVWISQILKIIDPNNQLINRILNSPSLHKDYQNQALKKFKRYVNELSDIDDSTDFICQIFQENDLMKLAENLKEYKASNNLSVLLEVLRSSLKHWGYLHDSGDRNLEFYFEYLVRQIIELVGHQSPGEPQAVNALAFLLIYGKLNAMFPAEYARTAKLTFAKDFSCYPISIFKSSINSSSFDIGRQRSGRFTLAYYILWDCAKNISYIDFYDAWHGKSPSDGRLVNSQDFEAVNLRKNVSIETLECLEAKESINYLFTSLVISEDQPEDLVAKRLFNRLFHKILPNENLPKLRDLADLEREIFNLKQRLEISHIAIIFHKTEPHSVLVNLCRQLADILYIGWITDQPVPFRTFHPDSTDLVSAIQSWLDEIA